MRAILAHPEVRGHSNDTTFLNPGERHGSDRCVGIHQLEFAGCRRIYRRSNRSWEYDDSRRCKAGLLNILREQSWDQARLIVTEGQEPLPDPWAAQILVRRFCRVPALP